MISAGAGSAGDANPAGSRRAAGTQVPELFPAGSVNLCLVVDSGRTELVHRPIPTPGPRQLLIKVETVRVQPMCVGLTSGKLSSPSGRPIVPGQEFCGSIVSLGVNVDRTQFKERDRVAVMPMSFCERCFFCQRGQTNLCETGAELFGWDVDGGYQQYVCVSHNLCHSFDRLVSWKQAVLASSAAAASYGMTKASIHPGDTVLIIGSSVTAMMGVAFARGLGAEYICVVGVAGSNPQTALSCGASKHITWDPNMDQVAQLQTVPSPPSFFTSSSYPPQLDDLLSPRVHAQTTCGVISTNVGVGHRT